jgi:hypothetical protein
MNRIAAIPTTYAGVRFRSRLEADWARAFDDKRIRWAYEPQGVVVGGVAYLPDFWLPDLSTVVEVKGFVRPLDPSKIIGLARANVCHVVLAEAPAGDAWAVVEPGAMRLPSPLPFGLLVCPACSAWQFMVDGQCRVCPEGNGTTAQTGGIDWREWARGFARTGRYQDAADCIEQAKAEGR